MLCQTGGNGGRCVVERRSCGSRQSLWDSLRRGQASFLKMRRSRQMRHPQMQRHRLLQKNRRSYPRTLQPIQTQKTPLCLIRRAAVVAHPLLRQVMEKGTFLRAMTVPQLYDKVAHNWVSINFVWTLITGFLVMFMQAGFAMVEGGLCRSKNSAHTFAMNFMIYPLGCIGFYVYGFALGWGNWCNGPVAARLVLLTRPRNFRAESRHRH